MSPAGATASGSKAALRGKEVFDNRISLRKSDNGGVIVSASFRYAKPKGRASDPYPSSYCPDKETIYDSWAEASAYISGLMGDSAKADD